MGEGKKERTIDIRQSVEYQKGYQVGFIEGTSKTLKTVEKQLLLAYMSCPIVINASKELINQ